MQGYVEENGMGTNEEDLFRTKTPMTLEECRNAVQSIFSGTTCYDLISQSGKVIVFEKTFIHLLSATSGQVNREGAKRDYPS